MFYIDQLHIQSFSIGLVTTEPGFINRSVKTGLGIWTPVVAVISVDAYPVLVLSGLTCHLEDTRMGVALLALCCLIVRRLNLKVVTKRLLHQQVVLVSYSRMEVRSYSCFWWCGYFWDPWVSFVSTDKFSVRVPKITSTIGVSWTHSLPFYF